MSQEDNKTRGSDSLVGKLLKYGAFVREAF